MYSRTDNQLCSRSQVILESIDLMIICLDRSRLARAIGSARFVILISEVKITDTSYKERSPNIIFRALSNELVIIKERVA